MVVAIKVTGRINEPRMIPLMDFEIYINGESDNTLYRMQRNEPKFRKLFSLNKPHGYAVRGNIRKEIQKLVDSIFDTEMPFAMAIIEE